MVLMIIIPIKWLFHWEYTLFSDKPIFTHYCKPCDFPWLCCCLPEGTIQSLLYPHDIPLYGIISQLYGGFLTWGYP